MSSTPTCRFCATPLVDTFVDLGMSPPCEDFLPQERLNGPEVFYPLHVRTVSYTHLTLPTNREV